MEWKSIIEICTLKQWKTISVKKLGEVGYPVYGANGIIGYYNEYNHEKDTLMITCRGATCGKINRSKGKSYINGNAMSLDDLNENIINISYLYYYLMNYDFSHIISGSAQPQITITNLSKLRIPVPSMPIQQKIVEVLDEAQRLIYNRKYQIELLDKLTESVFYDMFGDPIKNENGWKIEELGNISDLKAGKNKKTSDIYSQKKDRLYPCYGGNGIRGYVDDYSHFGEYNLIGRQGALCGNVNYVTGKFYATEHAVVVKPYIDLNTIWLNKVLVSINLNKLATGAAQPGLTVGNLKKVKIPIPPLHLQNQFALKVESIEKQKQLLQNSLNLMQENYNCLMQRAFNGELFN